MQEQKILAEFALLAKNFYWNNEELNMGGKSGPISIDNIDKMAEKVKSSLSSTGKTNVFISFAYEDLSEVNLLRGQAKNNNNELEFSDWSVRQPFNSMRAEYIRQKIKERIERASVTLVFLSNDTGNSDWVNWEIKTSLELNKGIVAMYTGDRPQNLPAEIINNNIEPIEWTRENLNTAIKKASSER